MNRKTKLISATVAVFVTVSLVVLTNQSIPQEQEQIVQQNPKFAISSWDYPDAYGQGIDQLRVYENSTGSWVLVTDGDVDYDETVTFEWTVGVGIKINCYTYFNSTFIGAGSTNEGKLYQQHNVTVTNQYDTVVYSLQNFTYSNANTEGDPMWYYTYYVILNFALAYGAFYTVTIIYELFY